MNPLSYGLQQLLLLALRGYRVLSWAWPKRCRFYPSCSQYMIGAITQHGPYRGTLLGANRLLRCHPLNPGGIDLVPHTH